MILVYFKASTLKRNNLEFSYQVLVSIMTTQRRILFDLKYSIADTDNLNSIS